MSVTDERAGHLMAASFEAGRRSVLDSEEMADLAEAVGELVPLLKKMSVTPDLASVLAAAQAARVERRSCPRSVGSSGYGGREVSAIVVPVSVSCGCGWFAGGRGADEEDAMRVGTELLRRHRVEAHPDMQFDEATSEAKEGGE